MLTHRLNYRRNIPIWINEGFAIWVEPSFVHQHYQRQVANGRETGKLFRVRDLARMRNYPDEDRVKIFYGQCFSLSNILIMKRGLKKFLRFVDWILATRTRNSHAK